MKRVGIIGSGNVGANSAFFIAENHTASVTLVDLKEGLSAGKSLDMLQAGPIRRYDTDIVGGDDIKAIRGCDIVVIAAGRVRAPDQSRDELYKDNAQLTSEICEHIKRFAPDAIVINVVEPVDMITLLAQRILGFDRNRVLGIGGLLSSTRLRYLVSNELGVSSREVTGMVIGPHRPSMVAVRDTIRISGVPAEKILGTEKLNAIIEKVRKAGDTILQMAQRHTSYYAPSAAVAALVNPLVRGCVSIMPVSMRLEGEYGLNGIAVSIPGRIGKNGVEKIVSVRMTVEEKKQFSDAADDLRSSLARATR